MERPKLREGLGKDVYQLVAARKDLLLKNLLSDPLESFKGFLFWKLISLTVFCFVNEQDCALLPESCFLFKAGQACF